MTKELDDDTKAALAAQQAAGGEPDPDPNPDPNPEDKGDPAGEPKEKPEIKVTDPDNKEGDPPGDPDPDNQDTKLSKNLADAGYSEEDLIARVKKDDGISDELVAELKEKMDPDIVDAHAARLRAEYKLAKLDKAEELAEFDAKNKATQDMNTYIYDSVGGEDNFKTISDTLKGNMSQTELDALNVKLSSGNKEVVQEALTSAVEKYNNVRGMGGKLMEGDGGNGEVKVMHLTKAEHRDLMKTDKYKSDPIYARKIDDARMATQKADKAKYGPGHYYGFENGKGRYSL